MHLTNDAKNLTNLRPYMGKNPLVYAANGESMRITNVGDMSIIVGENKRILNNAYLVPDCSESLISIARMLNQHKDKGVIVTSDSLLCEDIRNIIKGCVKFAELWDGTYYLSLD